MTISRENTLALIGRLRRRGIPYFFSGKIGGAVTWRLYALRLGLKGMVSIKDALVFSLPIRSGRGGVIPRVKDKIDEDIRKFFAKISMLEYDSIEFGSGTIAPPTQDVWGWLQLLVLFYQIMILDQYHAKDYLSETSTIIDAGANVGVFACYAASLAPKGQIFAFEPAPPTAEILQKNVAGYPNITIIKKGLGKTPGTATLRIKPQESGSSSFSDSGMALSSTAESPIEEKEIAITTIDSFAKEKNLQNLNFIKIDTEGYEKQIILGASESIKKFKPVLTVSAYHHPDDKQSIPETVLSISPNYDHFLSTRSEEDLVFSPKTAI